MYFLDILKKEVFQVGLKINQEVVRGNYEFGRLRMYQVKVVKFLYVFEFFEIQGLIVLRVYLKKFKEDKRMKLSKELMEDLCMRKVIYLFVQVKEFGLDYFKMEKLKEFVKEQFGKKLSFKIIVFMNYCDIGKKIVEELCFMGIIVERFIGQVSRKDDRGMSQREQKEVFDCFLRGEFNVFVVISVGEEGLDVFEVDLVVFYEFVFLVIRSIQRCGRIGRYRLGRVVIFMVKGMRDEVYYWVF